MKKRFNTKIAQPKYKLTDVVKYLHKEDGELDTTEQSQITGIQIYLNKYGVQANRYVLANLVMVDERNVLRKLKSGNV